MPNRKISVGYLQIDHRDSPGISQQTVHDSGVDAPVVGAGHNFETDVASCSHCQAQILLNPTRKRARAYCRSCDRYVCDTCAAVMQNAGGTCSPFAKTVDILMAAAARGESMETMKLIHFLRRSIT